MTTELLSYGLLGGFLGTVVMTILMMTLGDGGPPPTSVLWSKYVGDGSPEEYKPQGMALHFLYGTVGGGVFAVALPLIMSVSLTTAVLGGVIFGLVLTAFSAAFWMPVVLGFDPEPKLLAMFTFFHIAYGAVLGFVVGFF